MLLGNACEQDRSRPIESSARKRTRKAPATKTSEVNVSLELAVFNPRINVVK